MAIGLITRHRLKFKEVFALSAGPWHGIVEGDTFLRILIGTLWYREGVYAPSGPPFLAHAKQKVIVGVGLRPYS